MKRIYIAGPLGPRQVGVGAGTLAIEYLMNVRTMVQAAVECIDRGWSPFCPGLDFTYFISLPDGKVISEDKIKGVSMAWVEVCDALLLVGDWTKSRGALSERDRAIERGIPIYSSLQNVPAMEDE